MKKLLLKTWLLLTCLLLGVGTAWAEDPVKCTSTSDLTVGGVYYISGADTYSSTATVMGLNTGGNNFPASTFGGTPCELTLGGDATNGWTFSYVDGSTTYYLDPTNTTSSNYLKRSTSITDYGKFTISFSNGAAVITSKGKSSRNIIRYNSSSSCYSCYSSGQGAVYLYKKVTTPSEAYTVTFNAGDNGSCSMSSLTESEPGAGVTLPDVTTNTGYRFEGWSTSSTPTSVDAGKAGATYKPSSNCTLYAYYVPVHTAQFSINGTITPDNNCTVANGETITFPADPAVDGVVFKGWAKDAIVGTQDDAPTMVDKATETIGTEDVTYYAVFAMQEGEETTETFGWEEATTPANWTIGGTITRTAGTETNPANSGSYYGALNSNCSVQFKNKVKVKSFSYYCVRKTSNTNTSIKIETSTNGTSWTEALSTTWNTFNSDGKTYKKIEKTWDTPTECYVRVNIVTAAGRMLDDVSITYGDVTYSDYCTSVSALTSIAVTTAPTKVLYKVGESYDPTGLVITGTYENGNTRDITASCTNNAEDPLTGGHKTITYTYQGKTCTQEIDVVALDHIAVTTAPAKTVYTEEEDFDATGMVVTATWGTEENKTISETVETTVTDGENLTVGKTSVTISFTHEGTTKTTTQAITVNAIPTYVLTITQPELGGTLTVKNGDDVLSSGANVRVGTNLTCEVTDIPDGKRFSRFYFNYGDGQNKYKATNPATFDDLPTEGFTEATITVSYQDLVLYTINYMVNGVNTDAQENVYEGTALVFPTPDDVNGKSCVGWVVTEIVGTTDTAPSLVNTTGLTATADKTYYAVFATQTGSAGGEVTEELTNDEINSLSSSAALAYTTEKTYTDGTIDYSIYAYTDNTNRKWIQIKKDQNVYVKMTAPAAIKNVEVTITSPTNSSGGINDITKHTAYSGTVALCASDCSYTTSSESVASTSTITSNVATLEPTGDNAVLYLKVSTGARIWALSVTYGTTPTYSGYCTTVPAPATSVEITITAAGYATFFDATHAVTLPSGVKGYVWSDKLENMYDGDDEKNVIPAGEPVVLGADAGTYTLTYTTSSKDTYKSIEKNDLCGAATNMTADQMDAANSGSNYFYGLSLNNAGDAGSVGFYWRKEGGAAFDITAGKAYLVLPQSAGARSGFAFNEETEALESIEVNAAATTIYTLNGVKVNELQKGLNIVNGKKIMVK